VSFPALTDPHSKCDNESQFAVKAPLLSRLLSAALPDDNEMIHCDALQKPGFGVLPDRRHDVGNCL
jgi:hypothetical protein